MSMCVEPPNKLREFELEALGFLHLTAEFKPYSESQCSKATARHAGARTGGDQPFARLLHLLHDALGHTLRRHRGGSDHITMLRRKLGQFPQ